MVEALRKLRAYEGRAGSGQPVRTNAGEGD
jgi:hypothetical protein